VTQKKRQADFKNVLSGWACRSRVKERRCQAELAEAVLRNEDVRLSLPKPY